MVRFGLIGHPLTGSGSPALFAKAYGGRWPYDLIDCASFDEAWEHFLADYQAVNVTAPFKRSAYERVAACGRLSEEALAVGAVNIVVKEEGFGLAGYNSDYLGVRALLEDEGFGRGDVAVVAGFGGAGRAAAAAASSLRMDVVVCNRSPHPGTRPLSELPVLAGVADILIYTLPVAVPEAAELLAAAEKGGRVPVVLEANYHSPCMEGAAERYISGRRWLLEQARAGYQLMTGEKPVL
ncbi:MAG: hypothetical protein II891_07470 [Bacteroidales bacterium]|nr:hypothetical protein [Bacteroidales bacterium]